MDIPAPMSGSVIELLVAVGDAVSVGQELLIIESMKMEIPLESPGAGTVAEIVVAPPQPVSEGELLLRIE
ncbi:MAG TPA: biotin/lipoyl-containing protein [Tepidiformaceae bacterium]|nr:biotin/lipoyl-containing protein [Tepidiformaceae bacterium]